MPSAEDRHVAIIDVVMASPSFHQFPCWNVVGRRRGHLAGGGAPCSPTGCRPPAGAWSTSPQPNPARSACSTTASAAP